MNYETKELQLILEKHQQYLDSEEGGERANLRYANLRYANLSFANLRYANLSFANLSFANLSVIGLWGCTGNMEEIKSIFLDTYQIEYTEDKLHIGCERHLISEWWDFTEEEIHSMDGQKAMDWWAKYKPLLKNIIELSPAVKQIKKDEPEEASTTENAEEAAA